MCPVSGRVSQDRRRGVAHGCVSVGRDRFSTGSSWPWRGFCDRASRRVGRADQPLGCRGDRAGFWSGLVGRGIWRGIGRWRSGGAFGRPWRVVWARLGAAQEASGLAGAQPGRDCRGRSGDRLRGVLRRCRGGLGIGRFGAGRFGTGRFGTGRFGAGGPDRCGAFRGRPGADLGPGAAGGDAAGGAARARRAAARAARGERAALCSAVAGREAGEFAARCVERGRAWRDGRDGRDGHDGCARRGGEGRDKVRGRRDGGGRTARGAGVRARG